MAVDDLPSRMADIGAGLCVDANYASQYRLRLIAADMIHPAGHGRVDFTLPYLRVSSASTPHPPVCRQAGRQKRRPTKGAGYSFDLTNDAAWSGTYLNSSRGGR